MQRPHPAERARLGGCFAQRIAFGQGKVFTTSGTISPITSMRAGRASR